MRFTLHLLAGLLLSITLSAADKKPNVLFIAIDDQNDWIGYLGGHPMVKTPHIDRLAREGMRFTDAHSPASFCVPTRYGLMTGRYPHRANLNWRSRAVIAKGRTTIASALREKGYATAMVGKWHLGFDGGPDYDYAKPLAGGPLDRGFDSYFGIAHSLDIVPYYFIGGRKAVMAPTGKVGPRNTEGWSRIQGEFWRGGPIAPNFKHEEVLPRFTAESVKYIEGRKGKEQPFFLYFPMPSPHTPIAPGGKFKGITGISPYADFLVESDWAVGEIMKALDETGQADNTVVFFTCDNGTSPKANFPQLDAAGVHLNANWRGWKADAYEGGHRVPFIVRWPGRIKPGTRSDETIVLTDIMASCAGILGTELSANTAEDSVNLLPVLRGGKMEKPLHDVVIHHSGSGHFAIRKGQWKLLLCRGSGGWSPPREAEAAEQKLPMLQLYDLASDPKESKNLQAKYPDKVKELAADLAKAFRNGRTTPGPRQQNEGWPYTVPKPVLQKFPQLADPKIKS